jgi:Calx-beta domain/WD40-like Beta Propeller Repeat
MMDAGAQMRARAAAPTCRLALALALVVVAMPATHAASPGLLTPTIAFTGNADASDLGAGGPQQLWSVAADMTGAVRDTAAAPTVDHAQASASADPSSAGRIVFARRGAGSAIEIRGVDSDGTGDRLLADQGTSPKVSLDGTTLTFRSTVDDAAGEIYVASPHGRDPQRVTNDTAAALDPAPSPDGDLLAYTRQTSAGADIWLVRRDGEDARPLTDDPADEYDPAFSPDGSLVAFTRQEASGPVVHLAAADGSGTSRRLGAGGEAAWFPDGERLLVTREGADGDDDIWSIVLDGGAETRLIAEAAGVRSPSVSPDGEAIAFAARGGIFKAHADGSAVQQVTGNASDREPYWGPAPPLPLLFATSPTVTEGTGTPTTATVRLLLQFAPDAPVSVRVATADGSARQPSDYGPVDRVVTFAPGDREEDVTVAVAGDAIDEPDEHFDVVLSDVDGATLPERPADRRARVTLTDDDEPPALSITDVDVTEGDIETASLTFTVRLSHESGWTVRARAATRDGTATAPHDYRAVTKDIELAPGETQATVTVDVVGDTVAEGDHDFLLELTGGEHAILPATPARAVIRDDDAGGKAPITKIVSGPEGPTNDPTPTFAFVSSVPERPVFECSLDGGPFVPCTAPLTLARMIDGAHRFSVRARDGDLADPTPPSRAFVVDTIAPTTAIASGPTRVGATRSLAFELRANEPATFECRLTLGDTGGGAWSACEPHTAMQAPDDGTFVFEARAVDAAANRDATPAIHRFRVDTTPPDTRIDIADGVVEEFVDEQPAALALGAAAGGRDRAVLGTAGVATVTVACPLTATAGCRGSVSLWQPAPRGVASPARALSAAGEPELGARVARTAYTAEPGTHVRVRLELPVSIRERVERTGRAALIATAETLGGTLQAWSTFRLTADPRLPRVRDAGLRVAVHRGVATLRLFCPQTAACRGRVSLVDPAGRLPNGRPRVLGARRIALRRERTVLVPVRLSAAGRATLTRRALAVVVRVATGRPARSKRVELTLIRRGAR